MTARGAVPLSQPPGNGTAGQMPKERDTAWDSGGTYDLKALARKVLKRDTPRDSQRDSGTKTVPSVVAAVEQRDKWNGDDWRDWITERAAILEHDGGLPRAEADQRAYEHALIEWQNRHPFQGDPGRCAGCDNPIDDRANDWRPLLDGATVHYGGHWGLRCVERHGLGRREEAAAALAQLGIGTP